MCCATDKVEEEVVVVVVVTIVVVVVTIVVVIGTGAGARLPGGGQCGGNNGVHESVASFKTCGQ